MKNLLTLLFISLFGVLLNAQAVKGRVIDSESKEPLESVHVYTLKEKGALTDKNGNFTLKLSSNKEKSIFFSFIGYETKSINYSESNLELQIHLTKKTNNLNEVIIHDGSKKKQRLNYEQLNSMPTAAYSFGSVLIDKKIYVIAGDASYKVDGLKKEQYKNPAEENFLTLALRAQINVQKHYFLSDMSIYNIETNSWVKSDVNFKKRAYHKVNYNKDKIYVIGGKRMSKKGSYEYLEDQIEIFNLKDNTIEIDDTNPHEAVDFESFIYEDNIIVLGGSIKRHENGRVNYSNKVHFYNMSSGYWYELQDMISAKEIRGILLGDKIYVFGGFNNKSHTQIELYDLIADKWSHVGSLGTNLKKPAISHNNEVVFIFENNKIFTIDVNKKIVKEYLISLDIIASEIHYFNNKLYIIGGYVENEYSISPSKKVFSIDLSEFDTTNPKAETNL